MTDVTEIQHAIGGGQQLQEQEAVVVADGTVAATAFARHVERGDEAVQRGRGFRARIAAVVEAEQRDHAERNQAHRHHAAERDAAGQERLTRIGFGEARRED